MTTTSQNEHQAHASTWDQLWKDADQAMAERRLGRERQCQRWRVFAAALKQAVGDRPARCVELGAGEGDFSVLLAEQGHQVTLVDFSQQALARARERFERLGLEAEYVCGDMFEFAEQQAGTFDAAASLGVAEHFSGPKRQLVIDAHRRVLRPGGVALISVPNACCVPYRLWKSYLHLRGRWRYGYEAPYTPWEMRGAGRRAGFEAISVYNTGFAASVDACVLNLITGRRRGWRDGPRWLNQVSGWSVNLLGRAA